MTTKQLRCRALERQVERLTRRIDHLNRRDEGFVRLRVAAVAAEAVVILLVFAALGGTAGWLSVLLALLVFNIIAFFHRRIKHSILRHQVLRSIKQTHIARIRLDWGQIPLPPDFVTGDHPFAQDLELVGERSLHHLIDTAITREGSQRLAEWFLNTTPDSSLICQRQALVRELLPLMTFRDKLALNARLVTNGPYRHLDATRLLSWFAHHTEKGPSRTDLVIAVVLVLANLSLMILSAQGIVPTLWPLTFLAYGLFSYVKLRAAGDLFIQAMSLSDAIGSLQGVFHFLETYRYGKHHGLKALCAPFLNPADRPSIQLRRLSWIISAASLRVNAVLWTLANFVVPWDLFFAYQLSRRKADIAARMPVWLDRWFEIEALSSLAAFAALNPEYLFPKITDESAFSGIQLGHPLIPAETKVGNDFELQQPGSLFLITGSNMSGKSSFLRTLGVNLALAYSGSVANAEKLDVGLFRLHSCIRVNDSLTDGFSYFYAEVRRLKALLDALKQIHPFPVFYLIDEIFKGTNNRERLIGSRAYIRALVGQRGMGAISTRDLDLVHLADEMPQISNVHFREEVVDGQMLFDYRLRPGPCPTTNALKIMAMEGLPVPVEEQSVFQD